MHRKTIIEAVLGTALLFKTVFQMPEEALLLQIIDWFLVFGILIICLEAARDWEKRTRRKIRRRKRDGLD